MFQRENAVGLLLLGVCAFMAGLLIYSIATGTSFEYTGPRWLITVLTILFLGGILFGLFRGFRGGPGSGRGQWPDPRAGQRGWRRWFGKDDSGGPDKQG